MKNIVTLSIWLLTFAIGGALFWTSNEVQLAEADNKALTRDLSVFEERIAILSAEWHYLNNPAYLDHLTSLAFNQESSENKPLMLVDSGDLPQMQVAMLPVRKPNMPEDFKVIQKESVKIEAPIIVASAKKVHSVKSTTAQHFMKSVARPSNKNDFSMILANWTE